MLGISVSFQPFLPPPLYIFFIVVSSTLLCLALVFRAKNEFLHKTCPSEDVAVPDSASCPLFLCGSFVDLVSKPLRSTWKNEIAPPA